MCGFRWSDVAHFTARFDTDDLILSGALKPKQSRFSPLNHASTLILSPSSNSQKRCAWCQCDSCRFALRKFAKLTHGNAIHCKHAGGRGECDGVNENFGVDQEFGTGECACQGNTFDEHYRMGSHVVDTNNAYGNCATTEPYHAGDSKQDYPAALAARKDGIIIKKSYEEILMEDEVHMDSLSHSQLSSPTADLDHHQQVSYRLQDPPHAVHASLMQNQRIGPGIPLAQKKWSPSIANRPYNPNLESQSPTMSELLKRGPTAENTRFTGSEFNLNHEIHPSLNASHEVIHNPERSLFNANPSSGPVAAEMRMIPKMQNTKPTNAWNIDLKNPSVIPYQPHSSFDSFKVNTPNLKIVHPLIINQKLPKSSPNSKQKEQKDRIKRPLNAFMIFMREMRSKYNKDYEVKESALVNQIIAKDWNAMDDEAKQKYKDMAVKEKEEHAQKYPQFGPSFRDSNLTPGGLGSGRKKPRCTKKCSTIHGSDNIDAWCDICKSRRRVIKFARIVNEHDKSKPDQEPTSNS